MNDSATVEVVDERRRAELLLHPLRLRVLKVAQEAGSAADFARRLGLPPQKVNYHVQRLAEHGFLRKVEERRRRNFVEVVYRSTAASYVLASDVLGGLSPRAALADEVTARHWLALQARAESELGDVLREEAAAGRSDVATFSMEAEFRFESPEQRAMFTRALREVVAAVVSKYASPAHRQDGGPAPGRPYRMILGCHPVPEAQRTARTRPPGSPD